MCGSYDKDPSLWFATATATAIAIAIAIAIATVIVVVVSTTQIQQEETLPHVPSHHITSHHITPPPCFMPTPSHLVGVLHYPVHQRVKYQQQWVHAPRRQLVVPIDSLSPT